MGKKCKEINGTTLHRFEIDRTGMIEGVYIYKSYSENQSMTNGKISVTK